MEGTMRRLKPWVVSLLAVMLAAAAPSARAEGSGLQITGTTYTKWLSGNQRTDGSLYNFTTVPGEGYGDNGQGTEVELLLMSKLSRQVEVSGRIHSRFSQNQWTNFGGFGGRNPAFENPPTGDCVGGDCGEFDPRSNQYVKLRGMRVLFTPGYKWINSALIGASDFGMFDPMVIGKIRYIDRDNASGLLFQGGGWNRKFSYDVTRISLPRLWAGPDFKTGNFTGGDAAYGVQLKAAPTSSVDVAGIFEYVNDIEVDASDAILDDGQDDRTRFHNRVWGGRVAVRPSPRFDVSAAGYGSFANSASDLAPSSFFGISGFSPVPAGRLDDQLYKGNVGINDPFGVGLSFQVEAFDIGSRYVSMMAARRESDVLLTEGYDGTWAFPGPSNAAFGVFQGNPTRIGFGGWNGTSQQVATINVDNEFTDFDEPRAETAIGWRGVTLAPQFGKGQLNLGGEFTVLDYNTNWQAFDDDSRPISSSVYPVHELDTGVGHNFRSAYAPFQDKKTKIAVVNAKYTVDAGKGVEFTGKFKWIDESDKRMNDPRFLPYQAGDCPGGGLPCTGNVNNYSPGNSTSSIYSNPPVQGTGYAWKPFDDVADDDRDLQYTMIGLGVGTQLTDELYGAIAFERYDADLKDGNTAFQAYQLHEMASGKHAKNLVSARAKYNLGGAELGLEYQYNTGTFEPDFGTGFVPQVADATTAAQHNVPVGSLGFTGRFGGWNSLAKREFTQQRLKAFMKVQF
jgi:hypothetical protein